VRRRAETAGSRGRLGARLEEARSRLASLGDGAKASAMQRFFKTGPGEYGEGDRFLGVSVPQVRSLARACSGASLRSTARLLRSRVHEERLLALLVMVEKFSRGDEEERGRIYELYLENAKYVNNWDLVDLTAPRIVGEYLLRRDKRVLLSLARSLNLWERRISIVSTLAFVKRGDFAYALRVARELLADGEDLIHKAVGWVLREVGKRDMELEEGFLRRHYDRIPRTTLRYAIERFPERKRLAYLKGNVRKRARGGQVRDG